MEYLNKPSGTGRLGSWGSWPVHYRVLAVVGAAVLAYWLPRVVVPAFLRLARPVLLMLLVVAAVAIFPNEMCSMEWASKLPAARAVALGHGLPDRERPARSCS